MVDMESFQDFVLKLKVTSTDGSSQIRRVRLPRIVDEEGNVSYQELLGLAITFTFPESNCVGDFKVSLTYFDNDNDSITIASNEELEDAILLSAAADQRVLRITTEVKRNPTSSSPPPPQVASEPTADRSSSNHTDRGTSTGELPIDVHQVVEGIVGVLATAVNTLQEGLVSPGRDAPTPTAPAEPSEPAIPFIHGRHTCDGCRTTPIIGKRYHATNVDKIRGYDLCESCFGTYEGNEMQFETVELPRDRQLQQMWRRRQQMEIRQSQEQRFEAPVAEVSPSVPPPTPSVPKTTPQPVFPFIHGRHTCDSCLKTPIIGKRYHATNMKDYDLCENCHGNYGGTEIQFEPAELPRDRAFQKRWRLRQQNMGFKTNGPQQRRPGRPNRPMRARNQCRPGYYRPNGAALRRESQNGNFAFDGALKEAIRRSLQDAVKPDASDVKVESPKPDAVEDNTTPKDMQPSDEPAVRSSVEEEKETPAEASLDDVEICLEPRKEDIIDEKSLFAAMETLSVDSGKLILKDEGDKKPAAVKNPPAVTREDSPTSKKPEQSDSFAFDAIGNGDVAEQMGSTLDIVAGVISEMLMEAESNNALPQPGPEDDATVEREEAEEEDAAPVDGALILQSAGKTEEKEEDEESWHVVNDESKERENEIGNATQMLGSALFNSDMRASEENVSTLTDSSAAFSSATSVPSIVPSITLGTDVSYVAPAQRDRWAFQLEQLRELGFYDEHLCVDVLERLQAANIGVNLDDEVSVTSVVNAILEQK